MTHQTFTSANYLYVVAIYETALRNRFDAEWGRSGSQWQVTVYDVDQAIFSMILRAAVADVPVAA